MTKTNNVTLATNMLNGFLRNFMGHTQRYALLSSLNGEEKEGIAEIVLNVANVIQNMPKTYGTDGQGDNAVVYLHYFLGGVDAWVTERDIGATMQDDGLGPQYQAFGKMTLTGNKEDAELGYIPIIQLIGINVELDLYWTPKKLKEI